MTRKPTIFTSEVLTLLALMTAAVLSLLFMNSLVAQPKALFGQSLSAISPRMFPSIVLTLLAIMSAAALFLILTNVSEDAGRTMYRDEFIRAGAFFGIMIIYGLTMESFGFLISTAVSLILISLQMGARSPIQIGLVSFVGPVALYLAATRLLAVSLPELNAIELFYAKLF